MFPITESLHDALCDLRATADSSEGRTLWADAICIDQQNIRELQDQVSIIGFIYRKASRVIMYIGPERDDSTLAISIARKLVNQASITSSFSSEGVDSAAVAVPLLSGRHCAAVKALVSRTWVSCLLQSGTESEL